MVDDATLRLLRQQFPAWGIIHDPRTGQWIAVRGKNATVVADDAEELRMRLHAEEQRRNR